MEEEVLLLFLSQVCSFQYSKCGDKFFYFLVYKGQVVALKRNEGSSVSGSQELVRSSGISHPNIIQMIDFIEETQTLIMEYAEGYNGANNLQRFLEIQTTFLTNAIRFKFIQQITSAMAYLHSKNILHSKNSIQKFQKSILILIFL